MAHKAMVGGTAYDITGGRCLVGGTAYSVKKGRTLVGGTGYDVNFGSAKIPVYLDGHTDQLGYVVINGNQYYSGDGTTASEYVQAGDTIRFQSKYGYIWVMWFGVANNNDPAECIVPEGISQVYIKMVSNREYEEVEFIVTETA